MSGNSCTSALQTAPIVTAFWRGGSAGASGGSGSAIAGSVVSGSPSAAQVRELVFADLELVAVGEAV